MAFHFPLMPRLFMGLQMEDRFPIMDILEQTPEIPASCQWGIFLRNHDELTLEMVTDEERDYMFRLYAEDPRARINLGIRRRLAPLLGNDRRKIELINALLLSLPGTPIIYYGDEIGMGDNFYLGDRNGVRTPMQWSADRNAGFSEANPQQLYLPLIIDPEFSYEAINVDLQVKNPASLFWWMRRILDTRKRHPGFSQGSIEFLRPPNARVLAFFRKSEDETLLVVANLSRFAQAVALDLAAFKGQWARELFGGEPLVEITEDRTTFTLAPYAFYWLSVASSAEEVAQEEDVIPALPLPAEWSEKMLAALSSHVLRRYLPRCRWYGHKHRPIRSTRIVANFGETTSLRILLLEVAFADGGTTIQVLPLFFGSAEEGDRSTGSAMVARLEDDAVLWDALQVPSCRSRLWEFMKSGEVWRDSGAVFSGITESFVRTCQPSSSRVVGGEQSNTAIAFEESFLLKFLRKFEPGPNPDADILRALGEKGFPHVPRYAGEIRCRTGRDEGVLAVMTAYSPNQGDAWTFTLDALSRFFERVLAADVQQSAPSLAELAGANFPVRARQLGERTGELHACLASMTERPSFAPEPLTTLSQRSLYQSQRALVRRTEADLATRLPTLDPDHVPLVKTWLASTPRILERYAVLLSEKFSGEKIRVHGDYHLGQVLNTGNDFTILDFEGEPRRSLGERLLKRSPMVDVAGMLRSFDYAVRTSLLKWKAEDQARLQIFADGWLALVSGEFLAGYQLATAGTAFLPATEQQRSLLLSVLLLDKAIAEIGYELNYRPTFLPLPLAAVSSIIA